MFLLFLPVGICYPLFMRERLKVKRQEELQIQFKDAILAVSGCLNAGYSAENAFSEALKETDRVYGKESMMSREIRLLIHKTRLNRTVEDVLMDFAIRSGLEDVKSFADVFLAAKSSGGEMMKIISRTTDIISEKVRIKQDILTATAGRRMEQKIMNAVPFVIVFYMEVSSPGFFDVLYTTAAGRVIMTGCLLIYLGAIVWGQKILEIEV